MQPHSWIATLSLLLATAASAAEPASGGGATTPWDGHETVAAYAQRAGLSPTLVLNLPGEVKWEGLLIPAGVFVMGSPAGEPAAAKDAALEKQHQVKLTRAFYLGKYELTQSQFQAVMNDNPSLNKGEKIPVHNVTWAMADKFCQDLSRLSGKTVRLPTEAQWEYACRAGTTTAYYNGNTMADLEKIAWFGSNSDHKPHAGGEKEANAWGLYDMLGNIREYTRDLFKEAALEDATDPTGPSEGDPKNHVVRGGAYTANAAKALNCRCAIRRPTEALMMNGFRILVEVP